MSEHDQTVNPHSHAAEGSENPHWWASSSRACGRGWAGATKGGGDGAADGPQTLSDQMAETAFAFGHGARNAYSNVQAWGTEFERTLESDWKAATDASQDTWQKVLAAVKEGWACCTGTADTAQRAEDLSKAQAGGDARPAASHAHGDGRPTHADVNEARHDINPTHDNARKGQYH